MCRQLVVRIRRLTCAFVALGVAPFGSAAWAETFEVVEPSVEQGELEIEAIGAYLSGLPEADDDDEEQIRHAHEFAIGYGVTEFWKLEASLALEKVAGGSLRATNVGVESTIELLEQEEHGLGLGFFAAIEPRIHDDATNEVEFGPIFAFGVGPLEFTVNSFFEKSFGRNREEGVAYAYAAQSNFEFGDGIGVGFEAYGEVENIGEPAPVSEQEHRLGPVVYFETDVGEDQELSIALGVLFGLTEGTSDVAIKWSVELEL